MFELFFRPDKEKPGYYEFQVNAAGTKFDCFFPKRGAGDFAKLKKDGDFHIDIVAPNYYGHGFQVFGDDRGTVTILHGNGDGTFTQAAHVLTGASNPGTRRR